MVLEYDQSLSLPLAESYIKKYRRVEVVKRFLLILGMNFLTFRTVWKCDMLWQGNVSSSSLGYSS
jgi:hypothetical protein